MANNPNPIELVFCKVDGLDISLDVFVPKGATVNRPAPILLWWHGGGLLQGTRKALTPHLLAAPEKHGLCVVSADYRLAPQTRLPGILADCKAALDFLRSPAFASATGGRVDSSKLIVSGSSAGGWLALMAGTGIGYAACGLEPPAPVKGIVAIYPITDLLDPFWTTQQRPLPFFERLIDHAEVETFLDPGAEKPTFSSLDSKRAIFYYYMVQEAILASLLLSGTSIPPDAFSVASSLKSGQFIAPPTFIVHGTTDTKVPKKQSDDVFAVLKANGNQVEYQELEVDHAFDKDPIYKMERMYKFIAKLV